MTEVYCKCGVQQLEDTVCAECGEPLRVRDDWKPVEPDAWTFCPNPCEVRYDKNGKPTHFRRLSQERE